MGGGSAREDSKKSSMELLILVGSLLVFGNVIHPDIQSSGLQGELSHYELKSNVSFKKNGQEVGSFAPRGVIGLGLGFETTHQDFKNLSNTLNLRYYHNPNYHLAFYTIGLEYSTLRPKIPLQLSVGGEFGIGRLGGKGLEEFGTAQPTYGWQVHTRIESYFVKFDRLWNYYLRPSLQSYQFPFHGKDGIQDTTINGQGLEIATGIGLRF